MTFWTKLFKPSPGSKDRFEKNEEGHLVLKPISTETKETNDAEFNVIHKTGETTPVAVKPLVSDQNGGKTIKDQPDLPKSSGNTPTEMNAERAQISTSKEIQTKAVLPKKILVVESTRSNMSRECLALLKKLGFETVLFPCHDDSRKTIEERFRQHWDIHFAMIMIAGEEFSYPKDKKPKDARLRASQTTVLMLGFLLAKFGRQNTFVLYYEQESFLLPSDGFNVIYTAYNVRGEWRKLLVNRLKLSGFMIDENIDYQREPLL